MTMTHLDFTKFVSDSAVNDDLSC